MPYTAEQNKLFRAAAHDKAIAKAHGMSTHEAAKMAAEGVKRRAPRKTVLHKGA